MCAIVVQDLTGGDYAINVVDDELWQQIKSLPSRQSEEWIEMVEWLICDDPDIERSYDAEAKLGCREIERQGKTTQVVYAQRFDIELFDNVKDVSGVLFLG